MPVQTLDPDRRRGRPAVRPAFRPLAGGLATALATLAMPVRADVLVVDPAGGPGVRFAQIQSAVDAAGEGDTILVHDGTYQSFVVDGKSLTIVADGAGAVLNTSFIYTGPTLFVRNLASGQELLVQGLQADAGVSVTDCDGSVWFDRLSVSGDVYCGFGLAAGAYVADSDRVTFTRCFLRAESNDDPYFTHAATPGVDAVSASIRLFDCEVHGNWGDDSYGLGGDGGPALRLQGSTVMAVGCTFVGGEGGIDLYDPCNGSNGTGGAGVAFADTTSTLQSGESTAVGGVASLEPFCPGQSGPPGPAIAGNGTIYALAGFARHLEATSPVRGGETLTLDLEGRPGEIPALLVSLSHEPLPLLAYSGALLVGLPPEAVLLLPALPASGRTSLSFPVPDSGPGVGALSFYLQPLFLDPSARLWLGAGSTVVLLEAGL